MHQYNTHTGKPAALRLDPFASAIMRHDQAQFGIKNCLRGVVDNYASSIHFA